MTKEKIQKEIKSLETQRAEAFDNWSSIVKQNNREYEVTGTANRRLEKKAQTLLNKQKEINNQIMKLLDKLDE